MLRAMLALAGFLLFASIAQAAETVVHVDIQTLAQFQSQDAGAAPSSAQPAAAAIDGSQYAVIAPTFTGADGNLSYLRLVNRQGASAAAAAKTTTFAITVAGSPSGQVYGIAHIDVPALASPQYALSDILAAAGAGSLSGGDTGYSLYLQDADAVAYQHVIYNGANAFFEDMSVCDTGGYINGNGNATLLLPNVHTSILAGYPSQVFIHNFASTAATYQVTVVDARTGSSIGTVEIDTAANTSYTMPESFFEQSLGWKPTANQQHANLLFAPGGQGTANALVGQFIYNQALSAYINMSMACGLNAAPAPAATAERVFKGVIAQTQYQQNCQQCSASQDRSGMFTLHFPGTGSGTATVTGAVISLDQNTSTLDTLGNLGPSTALSGTYSADSGQVTMTAVIGGNGTATFTGSVVNGVLTGSYSGSSETLGTFAGLEATRSPVTAYCGSFSNGSQAKAFMLAADGNGTVTGLTTLAMGTTLSGQISGAAVSGQSGLGGMFSGTLANGQVTGTYTDTGVSAAFTASACPSPSPVAPSNGALQFVPIYVFVNNLAGGTGTITGTNNLSLSAGGLYSKGMAPAGDTFTLTATPTSGSTFHGWGGACSGTNPTCAVVLNSDEAVSATFCGTSTTSACTGGGYAAPYTFSLVVNAAGVTGYRVFSSTNVINCTGCGTTTVSLDAGTQLTLTASAPGQSTFVGWGGACSGTGSCVVTMNANTQVTATFKPATSGGGTTGCSAATNAAGTYALRVTVNQGGTGGFGITSSPAGFTASGNCGAPSASFPAGTVVTLTPTGSANQVFQSWSGACSGSGACVVTMNADVTVVANYFPATTTSGGSSGSIPQTCTTAIAVTGTHTLTLTPNLGGTGGYSIVSTPSGLTASGNCATASAAFQTGTSVTLTATGSANQVFQTWTGACTGAGTPTGTCTLVMDADKSVGASFSAP